MHPHSYLAVQQLAEDRRQSLQQGIRAAQNRAHVRAATRASQGGPVWSRALRSVRLLSDQPTT